MGIILLRKLALKSIIGFGAYRDLTVQDMLNLKRHKELIQLYYNLSGIDYVEEVKEHLRITPDREIAKPGKDKTYYIWHMGDMVREIINMSDTKFQDKLVVMGQKGSTKKAQKRASMVVGCRQLSKIRNRDRNQGHKY